VRGNGGFTLIELLVVIAIILILVGTGVPIYKNYVRDAKRARILTELNQCYAMFVLGEVDGEACRILKNTDNPQAIRFTPSSGCYQIDNMSHTPIDNVIDYGADSFRARAVCEDGRVWFRLDDT
jgi:prepilin-type N-terminal cleavage/methylation domain-containing protein